MNITSLKENEIFVFGSNLAGRHGAGAAKQAMKWGAIYGRGIGRQGQTYAIPTKDHLIKTLPLSVIKHHIFTFSIYAMEHPELKFLVTNIGCGLAGYKPWQIVPMFMESHLKNMTFSEEFSAIEKRTLQRDIR